MRFLKSEPLTAEAFAPFGQVIEMRGHDPININQGFAKRFNDLALADVTMEEGSTNISLFLGQPRPLPIAITLMERHQLGSQAFVPLQDRPWLIVVCGNAHEPDSFRAFAASGLQGINYARNVWHHPLLVLDADSRFLIVDRKGPGNNLEEIWLEQSMMLSPEG